MFQSGVDVSTLCNLKYGDVAEGLARNEYPLKLNLYRAKSGTEYYTFLGQDALEALKAYLADVKARGIQLSFHDPLFLKESNKALAKEGITDNLVQKMLREIAIKSGFVDEHFNGKDFNPLSPHALRESFASIMINKGVPDTIVDFWLGHEIGEMAEAYKRGMAEDLKRMYLEREPFISISSGDTHFNTQLQALINRLSAENMELKNKLKEVEAKLANFESFITEFNRIKEEVEFLKSDGVIIGTLRKLSSEEVKEVLEMAKGGRSIKA
jgi:hypothetical protein